MNNIENNEVYIVSTYLEDDEEYHIIAELCSQL